MRINNKAKYIYVKNLYYFIKRGGAPTSTTECPICLEDLVDGLEFNCCKGKVCKECFKQTFQVNIELNSNNIFKEGFACPFSLVKLPIHYLREKDFEIAMSLGVDIQPIKCYINRLNKIEDPSCPKLEVTEDPLLLATSKPCPNCKYRVVRPHGHACHHISPANGCPSCKTHFCYSCGQTKEQNIASRGNENKCLCVWDRKMVDNFPVHSWSWFCNKTINTTDIMQNEYGYPMDKRCGCTFCSDCKVGKPCNQCSGNCLVCEGTVAPGPKSLEKVELDKWFSELNFHVEIVIPEGTIALSQKEFRSLGNYKKVTKISLPESLTTLGNNVFAGCESLTTIILPNSIKTLGNDVFYCCSSLTSITIPNSVTTLENKVFYKCSSLASITIPNSVTTLGDYVFTNCISLTSITIPNSITTLGNGVFYCCSSLTSITIPNSVTTLGSEVFRECTSLTSITIPNSVTTLENKVFYKCSSLASITIPNSVTTLGNNVFYKCSSLASITIPNSVTTLGDFLFTGCSSLASITIPRRLEGMLKTINIRLILTD